MSERLGRGTVTTVHDGSFHTTASSGPSPTSLRSRTGAGDRSFRTTVSDDSGSRSMMFTSAVLPSRRGAGGATGSSSGASEDMVIDTGCVFNNPYFDFMTLTSVESLKAITRPVSPQPVQQQPTTAEAAALSDITREDFQWSRPPALEDDDGTESSAGTEKPASAIAAPQDLTASMEYSPFGNLTNRHVANCCCVHLVKFNPSASPDEGRVRLSRWIKLHYEKFLFAWWAPGHSTSALELSLLDLLDNMDDTGCSSALASSVALSSDDYRLHSNYTSDEAQFAEVDAAELNGKPAVKRRRPGLPVLQTLIELQPSKSKSALLVVDGANAEVVQYFMRFRAPRFGLHVIVFCDDYTSFPPGESVALLGKVLPLDLSIPDPDNQARFTSQALKWTSVHATIVEESRVKAWRTKRNAVLDSKRDAMRQAEIRAMRHMQSGSSAAAGEALNSVTSVELEEEDFKLSEAETAIDVKVQQLERVAVLLKHSPTLVGIVHRAVTVLGIEDLWAFAKDLQDTVESFRVWRGTEGASAFPVNRRNSGTLLAGRRSSAKLAPIQFTFSTSVSPTKAAKKHLTAGTELTAAKLSAKDALSLLPVTPKASQSTPSTVSNQRHLPPRRLSHIRRDSVTPNPNIEFQPVEAVRLDTKTTSRKSSFSPDEALPQIPLDPSMAEGDSIPKASHRSAPWRPCAVQLEAAALISLLIRTVTSTSPHATPLSFHTNSGLRFKALHRDALNIDDVALLHLSLALPRIFPSCFFDREGVQRMVDLGLWTDLGSSILVSMEVLSGLDFLCLYSDAHSPTPVGGACQSNELLGGYQPSSAEKAFALATTWLNHAANIPNVAKLPDFKRWHRCIFNYVRSEIGRRGLFLPEASAMLNDPRTRPPVGVVQLPTLPGDTAQWTASHITECVTLIPVLQHKARYLDAAQSMEVALCVCLNAAQKMVLRQDKRNGISSGRIWYAKLAPVAAVYCCMKEIGELFVMGQLAGVAERYAERAYALAIAICGDRRDNPAVAEAHFLLGRISVQLSAMEGKRVGLTVESSLLESDVGSNMQLTATLRAEVERKQYVLEARKPFSEAVAAWGQVPAAAVGDELALCYKTMSAALTHELRDRDAYKAARQALDAIAADRRCSGCQPHDRGEDVFRPQQLRDTMAWAATRVASFLQMVREAKYDQARALIETCLPILYLGYLDPSPAHNELVVANGRVGQVFADQLRPIPVQRTHLCCFTTASDSSLARYHGYDSSGLKRKPPVTLTPAMSRATPTVQGSVLRTVSRIGRSPRVVAMDASCDQLLPQIPPSIVVDPEIDLSSRDSVASTPTKLASAAIPSRVASFYARVESGAQLLKSRASSPRLSRVSSEAALAQTTNNATPTPASYGDRTAFLFAPHVLLEHCEPSDIRALDLLALMLDAGFDPRVCSPHSMETLLHIAVRRNLVVFISLLVAHPAVDVEYTPAFTLSYRRDGLSTIGRAVEVPNDLPAPVAMCRDPLTLELLLMQSHTPLATFQRTRSLVMPHLARAPTRFPVLFGEKGPFHSEVAVILLDAQMPAVTRVELVQFCRAEQLFDVLEAVGEVAVCRAVASRIQAEAMDHMSSSSLLQRQQASSNTPPQQPQATPPQQRVNFEISPSQSALMAHQTFSRAELTKFARTMSKMVKNKHIEAIQMLVDEFDLSIDMMHWEDAADFRRQKRALDEAALQAKEMAMAAESMRPTDGADFNFAEFVESLRQPSAPTGVLDHNEKYIEAFRALRRRSSTLRNEAELWSTTVTPD